MDFPSEAKQRSLGGVLGSGSVPRATLVAGYVTQ
jgi:hypothetical protein